MSSLDPLSLLFRFIDFIFYDVLPLLERILNKTYRFLRYDILPEILLLMRWIYHFFKRDLFGY
jgi:hypothetical protein